jgi:hypothetical protein
MTHPHACLLFVAFGGGTVLLGWWGARCAELRFAAQCPECLLP